ncbi:MAG: hypothetical protein IT445_06320 [Phycisphaeraceae bacterium]|nr:hypothetical protein [Phycisphaeraceae bacterium]
MTRRNIEIKATEFPNAHEAIQYTDASGRGEAVYVDGLYLVVEQREADRLQAAGVEFAYLHDHKGRIVTIPVN